MAKRYIRLNWQDRPSVVTPISAANLNKMDKGIDDIDTALSNLEASIISEFIDDPTKINNAAAIYSLKQSIDTLNNNLANQVISGIATGGELTTITLTASLAPKGTLFLLAFRSGNTSYVGAYIVIKVSANTLNLISLSEAQAISVEFVDNQLLITPAQYETPYTLINLTKFGI